MSAEYDDILDRLRQLRAADAPTHGGRVLSYVYDTGRAEIDELAAAAARAMQSVNGLDPTTFTSVAVLERDVVGFARDLLGGDDEVVGSVTAGGTESCLLAVKTARDLWRRAGGAGTPRLVAPVTVHAALRKAADLFGLQQHFVPVDPATGMVSARALIERLDADVALVVVSAPCYPFAAMDPIAEVAAACADAGVACHVDACIGGLILPYWPQEAGDRLPPWDFRVHGVTSISADLHKYGYAPKGVSVLLQRGRDRQRAQFFATTSWPGYPVVNPTLLGSKSAGPLAAAWAIIQYLGHDGFARLAGDCAQATQQLISTIGAIDGLRIVGTPAGPLIAVAADEAVPAARRVDPHRWADRVREHGWVLQMQPGFAQADGTHLPHTTHLTVTPVTRRHLGELSGALRQAADAVRGVAAIGSADVLAQLPSELTAALAQQPLASLPDSEQALMLLQQMGLVGSDGGGLPAQMAPIMALMEALPQPLTERLLVELLARVVEPTGDVRCS